MTGISLVTFFIAQIDKILLSKILPLSQFGYYTLAYSISSSLSLLTAPLSVAFFPRFASFFSAGKQNELKNLYHQACQLMAFFIFPFCFVLLFFMQDILRIWTHDATTTLNAYPLAQVLIVGSLFNSLMIVPYNLLIASGWTRFSLIQNTIAAIVIVPLIFWLTRIYGAMGAAYVWAILNLGFVVISQPLMHRKLLKSELKKWYFKDTLLPMLPSLVSVLIIKYLVQHFRNELPVNLVVMAFIFIVVFAISMLNMPAARTFAASLLKRKYFKNGG
jgi:O-antigen/teichoic acid export membrane protein